MGNWILVSIPKMGGTAGFHIGKLGEATGCETQP